MSDYGPQPHDADPLTRRCRLLQSWYQVAVLKQDDCGPFRPGGRCVGSTLVNGEHTGANFITPAAFAYAKEKVAEKCSNRDLTIDEYRLFNNMLSSQPMCFNLFSDLREGVQNGRIHMALGATGNHRLSPWCQPGATSRTSRSRADIWGSRE